jgi:hypothetical protein
MTKVMFPAEILIVAGVPILILFAVFWLVLEHRLSSLPLLVMGLALSMGTLTLAGVNPLGFFASPGGLIWFAALSLLIAAVIRGIRSAAKV